MTIIDCVSDLHGYYPKLDGGDLLIVAGDLTARDTEIEYLRFFEWLTLQNYRKIVFIAGNHDNYVEKYQPTYNSHIQYLCDSGTEFEGLKIWGSPWSLKFPRMNPKCMAFTCDTEDELAEKWEMIPKDTDILITHTPPWGILDKIKIDYSFPVEGISDELLDYSLHKGSKSLALKVGLMENPPKLWCWGHIHEAYGIDLPVRQRPCKMINASYVNEHYKPVNKPVRIVL